MAILADRTIVWATGLLAIAAILQVLVRKDIRPQWPGAAIILLGLLVALGFLSLLWSIDAQRSFRVAISVAIFAAAAVMICAWMSGFAADIDMRQITLSAAIGIILAAVLFLLLMLTAHPGDNLSRYNRPLCLAMLSAWPVAALLWHQRRRRLLALLAAAVTAAIFSSESAAAMLALLAGVFVMLLACSIGARLTAIMFAVAQTIGILLLVPGGYWLMGDLPQTAWLPSSAYHRLEIYSFAAQAIVERPWTGWGLSTFRLFPASEEDLAAFVYLKGMPTHVHNNFLEAWYDLGVVGFILAALLPLAAIRWSLRLPAPALGFATAGVASTVMIAMLSFGFTQSNWLAILIWITLLWALCERGLTPLGVMADA